MMLIQTGGIEFEKGQQILLQWKYFIYILIIFRLITYKQLLHLVSITLYCYHKIF